MRSLVLSLVLIAGVSAHAAAQRPSITRPIQKAREAAAKSGARTATAEAAGQEPAARRDSVPVTTAPTVAATKPGTSTASTTPPAGKTPSNGKAAAPANAPAAAAATSPASSTPANAKAPASKVADSARSASAQPDPKAPVTSKAPATAAAPAGSDKSGSPAPTPQAGTSKTPTAPAKTSAAAAAAATVDAASKTSARADSSAATISVGSSVPTRPELRIDREVFTYDAAGRRDPFVSLLSTSDLRPLFSDLLLVVINYDPQRRNSVAIMRDATTKEQYRVRQGQLIGRMRVAAIEQKRVLFTIDEFGFSRQESLVIGDTTKVRKQ